MWWNGIDPRNFKLDTIEFSAAVQFDPGLCRPPRYSVTCSKQEPTGGDPSLGTSRNVSTQRGIFP